MFSLKVGMIFEKMLARGCHFIICRVKRKIHHNRNRKQTLKCKIKKANNNHYHNLTNVQFKMGEWCNVVLAHIRFFFFLSKLSILFLRNRSWMQQSSEEYSNRHDALGAFPFVWLGHLTWLGHTQCMLLPDFVHFRCPFSELFPHLMIYDIFYVLLVVTLSILKMPIFLNSSIS